MIEPLGVLAVVEPSGCLLLTIVVSRTTLVAILAQVLLRPLIELTGIFRAFLVSQYRGSAQSHLAYIIPWRIASPCRSL